MNFRSFFFSIGIAILFIDQYSKFLTHTMLPLSAEGMSYSAINIFQQVLGVDFYLTYVANKGAAWGMLSQHQDALNFFRLIVIAMLLYYTFFRPKEKALHYPLIFITFGAIGNVLDYFVYGYVIDMFKFVLWGYHYPVFNVADSFIFLGVIGFFLLSLKKPTAVSNK